jgi:hypothetical protein
MVKASNYLKELAEDFALKAIHEERRQIDLEPESNYFIVAAEAAGENLGHYIDQVTVKNKVFYIYQKKM